MVCLKNNAAAVWSSEMQNSTNKAQSRHLTPLLYDPDASPSFLWHHSKRLSSFQRISLSYNSLLARHKTNTFIASFNLRPTASFKRRKQFQTVNFTLKLCFKLLISKCTLSMRAFRARGERVHIKDVFTLMLNLAREFVSCRWNTSRRTAFELPL